MSQESDVCCTTSMYDIQNFTLMYPCSTPPISADIIYFKSMDYIYVSAFLYMLHENNSSAGLESGLLR